MAVSRLGAGAHGPHGVDGPASGAFDAQIKGRPFGQHLVAVSTPDLVVLMCSRHFLMVLGLRPGIRPDMRLRARGLTVSHKRRRILRTVPLRRVGPWSGASSPGRWGSSQLPHLCLKFVFSCPFSRRSLKKAPARRLLHGGAGQRECADRHLRAS